VKVLAISDEVVAQIYSAGIRTRFGDVDLVLSCGDLPAYYLEYIVTMLNVPLYYVLGNHAEELVICEGGELKGPGGCVNINGRVVEYCGLLIAGLEGSMRYREGPHQYTEAQMGRKAWRLTARVLRTHITSGRSLDVLVTHAPPLGIHDAGDRCHTGFRAFLQIMERLKPQYMIHGHSHVYSQLQPTMTQYRDTVVVNAHPYRVMQIEPRAGAHEGAVR
jgi:Icc-related predicted phosphoesterase